MGKEKSKKRRRSRSSTSTSSSSSDSSREKKKLRKLKKKLRKEKKKTEKALKKKLKEEKRRIKKKHRSKSSSLSLDNAKVGDASADIPLGMSVMYNKIFIYLIVIKCIDRHLYVICLTARSCYLLLEKLTVD